MTKKAAAEKKAANPTAPEEVIVPPAEFFEPETTEPVTELMQVAGGTPVEDVRPLSVIASNLENRIGATKGKTLFVAKTKDHAVDILVNGKTYRATGKEGVWVWEVDSADVEMFAEHAHVKYGRIVQSGN